MSNHPRQAEADALDATAEDLLEEEQNRADERESRIRGIEIWELRMRREGASDAQIEAKRAEDLKKIHDIID